MSDVCERSCEVCEGDRVRSTAVADVECAWLGLGMYICARVVRGGMERDPRVRLQSMGMCVRFETSWLSSNVSCGIC